MHFFLVSSFEGEVKNMEPNKCSDLSWFDLDNLPNNMIPYIRKVIENIQNEIFYDEFGWD